MGVIVGLYVFLAGIAVGGRNCHSEAIGVTTHHSDAVRAIIDHGLSNGSMQRVGYTPAA
jgi:hypothetical protein